MTIQRMEHVGIVVDDLAAATAFFVERGLSLGGVTRVALVRGPPGDCPGIDAACSYLARAGTAAS